MEKPSHNQASSIHVRSIYTGIVFLGLASGVIYLFNFRLNELVPDFSPKTDIHVYVVLFLILSSLYWIAAVVILKHKLSPGRSKGLLGIIIFFAIAFRLCLIPMDPAVLHSVPDRLSQLIIGNQKNRWGRNPRQRSPVAFFFNCGTGTGRHLHQGVDPGSHRRSGDPLPLLRAWNHFLLREEVGRLFCR